MFIFVFFLSPSWQQSPETENCFYLHSVNLALLSEYHIIRKLEMATRPMSPAFPLLSSTESIISRIRSPLRSFLWLVGGEKLICSDFLISIQSNKDSESLTCWAHQTWFPCPPKPDSPWWRVVKLSAFPWTRREIIAVNFRACLCWRPSVARSNRNRSAPYNNLDYARTSRDG